MTALSSESTIETMGALLAGGMAPTRDEALDHVKQVACLLDASHVAGVVHGRLRPEVVLRSRDRTGTSHISIVGFHDGRARDVDETIAEARYLSPEQVSRQAIDGAVDVWAFGLLAYALLVGRTYWRGESLGALYDEILGDAEVCPCTRAREVGVVLPADFDAWLGTCLARNPATRFPTVGEAFAQLWRVFHAVAPAYRAIPHPAPPLPQPAVRRAFLPFGARGAIWIPRIGGGALIAGSAAIVVFLFAFAMGSRSEGSDAAPPSVQYAPFATPATKASAMPIFRGPSAKLEIDSLPAGAQVNQDGKIVCRATGPTCRVRVTGEPSEITLSLRGYRDTRIDVQLGDPTPTVSLVPLSPGGGKQKPPCICPLGVPLCEC